MASTRAATFSAKIRTLTDFHTRISCSQQPPCTAEIMTVLRFFQQTLIGFIKDLPTNTSTLFHKFTTDSQRTNLFPNLNYSGLFYGIVNLLDVFPLLQSGQKDIGQEIIATLKSLYFFLDRDCIDQLPYLIASQIGILPSELNKKLVSFLADCILPYSMSNEANGELSVPCILMLVLQQYGDPTLHTYIVESLMAHRSNVYNDIIAVIAKGTSEARVAAANLLFHYWPLMNPSILHRKPIQYKVHAWAPPTCEYGTCTNPSVKITYDPAVCAKYGNTSPPMRICKGCQNLMESDQPTFYICQPMPASNSTICQNKGCESTNRFAVGTCFSEDCIRSHQHVPLRLCQECFTHLHANINPTNHIRQDRKMCAWETIIERDMIEAIVKLLKETSCQLEGTEGEGKRPKWLRQLEGGQSLGRDIDSMADEKRMLSRYGIWLMAAMCPPSIEAPSHAVGYMMSMVFQWFTTTALLPNDSMGSSLEQLKTDFASEWVNQAINNHYDTFVLTLMPHVPEYAQVGGVWDKFCSRKDQLKEGLSKLLALMPYDVISFPTWNQVIPQWLKCISDEIDDEDFFELKILLCKIFEPDLCPLPFETEKVFEFILTRLMNGTYEEILDALDWLHLLCRMDITLSFKMILTMFQGCLSRLSTVTPSSTQNENDLEENPGPLAIQVVMISIVSQQMKLNENNHQDSQTVMEQLFITCSLLLQYPTQTEEHTCQNPETDQYSDCVRCQQAAFLYQIINNIAEELCPKDEVKIEFNASDRDNWLNDLQMTDSGTTPSHISNVTSPRNPSLHGTINSPQVAGVEQPLIQAQRGSFQYLTANVQEEIANDEFVGLLPTEEIETATAQATTLTETDVGRETCQIVTATLFESLKGTPLQPRENSKIEFWNTSVGRFRFSLDQLPAQLRLIYSLLQNIENEVDPDVQYFLLSTMKYLCLHCEALSNARREHRGFLIWVQENLLISKLWTLLRSDYAQVGQLAVPLLIHAITLPCGEEVFWNTVNHDFTSEKWEVRFKAVERVYVLAHLMVEAPVKANKLLQTSLSCAFSHLIVSVNDPNAAVAQRTLLALRALPSKCLNLMNLCLEAQFDSCILDRPLIISRVYLLTAVVPEENILTWEFFINRFETLAVEAQLKFQSNETGFVQGFANPDPMNEINQMKLSKARQSLNEAETVRSIVKSLRENSLKHQLTTTARVERVDVPDDLGGNQSNRSKGGGNYGRLREFTDEESNLSLLLNRVVDMENPERHTVYMTVTLLVHFLCNRKSNPSAEKNSAKKQSLLLRYFNTLLGYSNSEKCFTIPPNRLRKAAICNAFLNGLPDILDNNLMIGNQMLPIVVQLLLHLPSPQRFASDQASADYSLSLLEITARHSWLHTLIFILYKYRYDQMPINDIIKKLILIVISTIELHCHECKTSNGNDPRITDYTIWSDTSDDEDAEEKVIKEEDDTSLDNSQSQLLDVSETHKQLIRPESLKVSRASSTGGQLVTFQIQEMKPSSSEVFHLQPTIVEPTIMVHEPHERSESSPAVSSITKTHYNASRRNKYKNRNKKKQIRAECLRLTCSFCNEVLETFDEETLSLCLISLSTFVHREPTMAAPLLFRILTSVARFVDSPQYPWHDTNIFVPGNSRSAAKQLIRVTLHQMSACSIALQLFDSKIENINSFWPTVSFSLMDFTELNPVALIQVLFEDIMETWPQKLGRIMHNLAAYVVTLPIDACLSNWGTVINLMESFFRRYHNLLVGDSNSRPAVTTELKSTVILMIHVMRVQNFATFKSSVSLVEAYSKWLTEVLHDCRVDLRDLLAICTSCNRALIRERDKQLLTRAIVNELIQSIKFKYELVESNYLTIVEFILQDFGEEISADFDQFNTGASEAIRPFLSDILEFIADLHVLSKLKKQTNSDRMGGDLKAGLAEVVALEMSRPSLRDSRPVMRFIPWLMSPPNVTQAVPGAFADSVTNVRILSWLLLGALHASHSCLPVPIDCSNNMADYIHFVLAGFADQSKVDSEHHSFPHISTHNLSSHSHTNNNNPNISQQSLQQSVVHMSALFHAFHLCQLWTVYCEKISTGGDDTSSKAIDKILDFWSRVTPAILQLLAHSKVLADMVNLHFVNTMQALQQCNSSILCQLYPMWQPILTAYHSQIPSQLRMKLDACENQPTIERQPLSPWLKKVRYKISQIELQTSAASPFYNV